MVKTKRTTRKRKAEQLYIIEEILDKKIDGVNGEMYLIKWQGYSETTWEPKHGLAPCQGYLEEFEREYAARGQVPPGSQQPQSSGSQQPGPAPPSSGSLLPGPSPPSRSPQPGVLPSSGSSQPGHASSSGIALSGSALPPGFHQLGPVPPSVFPQFGFAPSSGFPQPRSAPPAGYPQSGAIPQPGSLPSGLDPPSRILHPGPALPPGFHQLGPAPTSTFSQPGPPPSSGIALSGPAPPSAIPQPGSALPSGIHQPRPAPSSAIPQTVSAPPAGLSQPGTASSSGIPQPGPASQSGSLQLIPARGLAFSLQLHNNRLKATLPRINRLRYRVQQIKKSKKTPIFYKIYRILKSHRLHKIVGMNRRKNGRVAHFMCKMRNKDRLLIKRDWVEKHWPQKLIKYYEDGLELPWGRPANDSN